MQKISRSCTKTSLIWHQGMTVMRILLTKRVCIIRDSIVMQGNVFEIWWMDIIQYLLKNPSMAGYWAQVVCGVAANDLDSAHCHGWVFQRILVIYSIVMLGYDFRQNISLSTILHIKQTTKARCIHISVSNNTIIFQVRYLQRQIRSWRGVSDHRKRSCETVYKKQTSKEVVRFFCSSERKVYHKHLINILIKKHVSSLS